MSDRTFTPALGRFAPVRYYDLVAGLTRERAWRGSLVSEVSVAPGELIVDVGCGTGSLALLLREEHPEARIIGVDPDPSVLEIAAGKTAGARIELREALGDELGSVVGAGTASAVVSSLVLHQCPMEVKRAILASMALALRPGGTLVIGDYGLQRTPLMRFAFRAVQLADGREHTQPNADGVLPELIAATGLADVREATVVQTITGSISVYVARRA